MSIFSPSPATMKIKLLSSIVGHLPHAKGQNPRTFNYSVGDVVAWEAVEATRMIARGLAVEFKEAKK